MRWQKLEQGGHCDHPGVHDDRLDYTELRRKEAGELEGYMGDTINRA